MDEDNPFAAYAGEEENPFAQYVSETPKAARRRKDKSILRKVDAAVRGAADFATFGYADEFAATMDSLPALAPGGETYGEAWRRNAREQRKADDTDKVDVPVSRGVGQVVGFGATLGVGAATNAGRAVPHLSRTGSALRGTENALRVGAMGAAYGGLAASGNATGDFGDRARAFVPGAALGGVIGAVSVPVSSVVGATARHLISRNRPAIDRAANALRGRFSVPEARARANALRAAGANPAAVSAMDEAGRGYVRAAASRQTPGREIVQRRAEAAALDLPDRVSLQARQHISDDPRSLAALGDEITTQITDATRPPDPTNGRAGALVFEHLNRTYNMGKRVVDDAFTVARQAAPEAAHLPAAERPVIAASLRESVRDFAMPDVPRVARALDDLDKLGTLTVRDLYDMRTRLSNLRVGNDQVEATAAARLVRALDGAIDDAVERNAITGDPQVVDLWRDAIAKRRTFGQLYEGDDVINRLTERTYRAGERTNAVAPEDASAILFGRGAGVTNRADLTRDLTRIRDRLGEDSAEWAAVQEEAVGRILGRDAGRETYGAAWDTFASQSPELAGLLMSPAQRTILDSSRQQIASAVGRREAMEAGEQFLQPGSADDFARTVEGLTPDQASIARLAARRRVEQAAGENISNAPGVARRIATAPEQQLRNRALLGDEAAEALEAGMAAEGRVVRDLSDVAPRTGSQTQPRTADQETANSIANGVATIMGGPQQMFAEFLHRLKTAGLSDKDAEALVDIATDPAQLEELLSRMEARAPGAGTALRKLLNQALSRDAGEYTQRRPTVEVTLEGQPGAYGAVYGPAGHPSGATYSPPPPNALAPR